MYWNAKRPSEDCTQFTAVAFEALWTVTQVGARLVLTRAPVLAGLRQTFIYVFGELKQTNTQEVRVCTTSEY